MRVHKADEKDFEGLNNFLTACEETLEKEKFSLQSPEEQWKEWDKDDDDYRLMCKIREDIAVEEDIPEDKVDNRIVCYEFLLRKFRPASGWRQVYWAATILVEQVCDEHKDYLDYHPSFVQQHVANEQ